MPAAPNDNCSGLGESSVGPVVTETIPGSGWSQHDSLVWEGVDRSGALVPHGLYLLRVDVDVDSKTSKKPSTSRLVHVAY